MHPNLPRWRVLLDIGCTCPADPRGNGAQPAAKPPAPAAPRGSASSNDRWVVRRYGKASTVLLDHPAAVQGGYLQGFGPVDGALPRRAWLPSPAADHGYRHRSRDHTIGNRAGDAARIGGRTPARRAACRSSPGRTEHDRTATKPARGGRCCPSPATRNPARDDPRRMTGRSFLQPSAHQVGSNEFGSS